MQCSTFNSTPARKKRTGESNLSTAVTTAVTILKIELKSFNDQIAVLSMYDVTLVCSLRSGDGLVIARDWGF